VTLSQVNASFKLGVYSFAHTPSPMWLPQVSLIPHTSLALHLFSSYGLPCPWQQALLLEPLPQGEIFRRFGPGLGTLGLAQHLSLVYEAVSL